MRKWVSAREKFKKAENKNGAPRWDLKRMGRGEMGASRWMRTGATKKRRAARSESSHLDCLSRWGVGGEGRIGVHSA